MNRSRATTVVAVIVSVLLTAAVTFSCTMIFASGAFTYAPDTSVDQEAIENKIRQVESCLDAYFIDDYDPAVISKAAENAAAAAMVEATGDEWSYYLTPEEMVEHAQQQSNSYVGIGITITTEDEGLRVMSVVKGGPADLAGVIPGDLLIGVEDKSFEEIGQDGAADLIRGEAGTDVNIRLLRDGETLELTVTRALIVEDVATATMLETGIGLVEITDFGRHCAEQTLACVDQLLQQGAKGIVFDLRFNPGGYKDELVQVLDKLLPEGVIFHSVDYAGEEEITRSDAECLDIPMVVLVNKDSYSAAEFFAAAMQEYDAAEIIGTQTYGKGNFQTLLTLSDGSGINLSIGKYYTPKGKSLTGVGIVPDQVVELSEEDYSNLYYGLLAQEEDEQLQASLEYLRQKIS